MEKSGSSRHSCRHSLSASLASLNLSSAVSITELDARSVWVWGIAYFEEHVGFHDQMQIAIPELIVGIMRAAEFRPFRVEVNDVSGLYFGRFAHPASIDALNQLSGA